MIERNRHPTGRLSNVLFGLCQTADGLVRIVSLGYLHTRLPLEYTKRQTKNLIAKLKKDQAKCQS